MKNLKLFLLFMGIVFGSLSMMGQPLYSIDLVTNDADGDGLGDSLGVACELRGVVHGIDLSGSASVSFTIIDATGGIGVFSSNNFGYVVTEGDSVHIPGSISQFNGLTQIAPDTIEVISSGNALVSPVVITSLGESTESELIRFNNAYLVDLLQWPASGNSANVSITNGTDTLTMRIDSDTDIDGTPVQTDTFDVIGIGGQFDSSSPYNDGYQMLPRYLADIMGDTTIVMPPGGVYNIAVVTADNDGDGVGDSLGVACELRGVVHGIDLSGSSSVSFTIIDGTGGIGVFSSNSFGYTVQEGDSVHIPGSISQFNGLTQIAPDTIELISSGNGLATPAVITSLGESTESELIRFNNAHLVDPAQWPASGNSANVSITNGTDTLTMRIDSDTDIDGSAPPVGNFDVIGIGGQFDSSSPYNDGYQMLPRYMPDIIPAMVGGTPIYAIDLVTNDADGDGLGDSLGVACELRGVVHGIDMSGSSSVSFTIIDGTGGIGVFSSNDFGYTVQEGDSLHIPGAISQFNGLTQIAPDTIEVISSGNALVTPAVITALGESTESELIRFNNAHLVDPGQWPAAGNSANVSITNGTDTLTMRIDSDTDIDGSTAPAGDFDVIGIGGQFDSSSPYNDGYQMLPRYMPDIIPAMVGGTPIYPIDLVTNDADGDGLGDSLGVVCELRGVVHGIDLSGGTSVLFTIIDGTGGIGVFSSNDFGYTVQEGDSVHIPGDIGQFNGLTQIAPDTIEVISSGNALAIPAVITALGESTESELIRFNNAHLVDPGQWPAAGTSVNLEITNGSDTITMRIDSDTDIDGSPAPTGNFDVVGIGGQFDNSSPYNDGYQLLPRYMPDIKEIVPPGFSFDPTIIDADEDEGTVSFAVTLPSAQAGATSVDVSLNGSSTATNGSDFSFMDTTLNFAAGVTSVSLSFDIIDDSDVESAEDIQLDLSNPTGGPGLGDSVLVITIQDNDYPQYPIGLITEDNDNDGVGDSLGVSCQIQGIVYGIDYQGGTNIQFTIIDSTGGINLFSSNDFGYVVQEGDEVLVPGEIVQFRGLTEIEPDTIIVLSMGNPIGAPTVVDFLDETTESEFIQIQCLSIVDTSMWPTSFSVNLPMTNVTDTFTVRIDSDTDIIGTPVPGKKWLDITGLGGQFTNNVPALDGYQILPRYTTDIVERPDPTVTFLLSADSVVEADGSIDIIIAQSDGNPDPTTVVIGLDVAGSTATGGDDFSFNDTTITLMGCGNDMVTISIPVIEDSLNEGAESMVLFIGEVSNNAVKGIDTLEVTILDQAPDAISEILPKDAISMFPNPTQSILRLSSSYRMDRIVIRNMLGQQIFGQEFAAFDTLLNVERLPKGVYLVSVETDQGVWSGKLIVDK